MPPTPEAVRVAIAGAASLRGRELKQCLEDSSFPASEIRLFDEDLVAGTLTEAGGEPAVIETVSEDSFDRVRFAFFTGSPGFSARHGNEARRAGATVIDLSAGGMTDSGGQLWIPALDRVLPPPDCKSARGGARSLFFAPTAPADIVISLSAALAPAGLLRLTVTLFQPVSERGQEGIEELEGQVVKLLSLDAFPTNIFDAQVGFNMLPAYGAESSETLAHVRAGIVNEVRSYLGGRVSLPAIALVHTPVFYSHAFMAYAEFYAAVPPEDLVTRLQGAGFKVAAREDTPPNNINVAGESRPVLAQPNSDPDIETGVWFWGAADNLRVPAATAVAIAEKLLAS